MKDLIIVGGGSFAKEALEIIQQMNAARPQWNILGFIDDGVEVGTIVFRGYRVIGTIKDWVVKDSDNFAFGISRPHTKEILYNLLKGRGARFATIIHPETHIPEGTVIGEGCVISRAWIGIDVVLGKCVNVAGSMIGESSIDDFSTTTGFANVAGATLGKRVFVGSHAVILNGKKVGDDAVVAAGSVVFSHVKPGITVWGNPAKKINL